MRAVDLPMLPAAVQSAALPVNRRGGDHPLAEAEISVGGKGVLCTRLSVRIAEKRPLFLFSRAKIAPFTVATVTSPSLALMLADRAGKLDVSDYCRFSSSF